MNPRTCIPEEIYHDEVVCFLADRYNTTPRKVLQRFLEQNGIAPETETVPFRLEENEMAILRDMMFDNHPQLWNNAVGSDTAQPCGFINSGKRIP